MCHPGAPLGGIRRNRVASRHDPDRRGGEPRVGDPPGEPAEVLGLALEERHLHAVVAGRLDVCELPEMRLGDVRSPDQKAEIPPSRPSAQAEQAPVRRPRRCRRRWRNRRRRSSVTRMRWCLHELRPLARPVLGMLQRTVPLDHRPAGEVVGGELREHRPEIHLAIARRAEPPRPVEPRGIARIDALPAGRIRTPRP